MLRAMRFVDEVSDGKVRGQPSDLPDGSIGVFESDGSTTQLIEELAPAQSARAELYRLLLKRKISPTFSPQVMAEVDHWVKRPGTNDPKLFDATDMPMVTIDGADSRDLDQALFVEPHGHGHRVHYALADASYYCPKGSALFEEALVRGASFYLPGLMVPMLPRELSEGLVSLNENVLRRCVLFSMDLNSEGVCTKTQVKRARVRSRGKLSFEQVEDFYRSGKSIGDPAVEQSLRQLAVVGKLRMQLADERNVVRYRRSEVSAKLADEGYRFVIRTNVRRDVERYNEQLSLLCNTEGAKLLRRNEGDGVEPIYRVHPPPDERKIQRFEKSLQALANTHGLDKARWTWRRGGSVTLADFLDALPTQGKLGRVGRAVHRQAIMINVRSSFQAEPGSHHGVGAEVYARFSAPMREVVGVFLHRELIESLGDSAAEDEETRQQVVMCANNAKQTQRQLTDEANRLVIDQILADASRRKKKLAATVMGMNRGKIYVLLDAPEIDVKVYVRDLPGDVAFAAADTEVQRDGKLVCRLGDPVMLSVHGRDEKRDRWRVQIA